MRENRTVPFRDTSIKVSRNYYGHQYICMADVCEIIKQRELLKDGAILNLCPSAMKMTFRRNGREYWAPAILKSISPRASSSPRMSVSTV